MPNNKQKKMREKITSPTTHRAVIPFDKSHSYFITIKIPAPPKIKIKIPKLLSKTMQKGFHGYNRNDEDDDGDHHHKLKRTKSETRLALRKVGSIFNNVMKKAGFGRVEGESSKAIDKDGHDEGICVANDSVSRGVMVIGRKEREGKSIAVSRRVLQQQGTERVVRSLRKIGSSKFDLKCMDLKHTHVAEKREALELCKKRILMGSKCKPLSISGALHYDKNGVLLPEELP